MLKQGLSSEKVVAACGEFSFHMSSVLCRGLETLLVEKEDFAAGTSSRSTKLVHGGVRYLEKAFKNFDYGQLKLVFEALHERKTVLDSAPHLAIPLPIMTVCSCLIFQYCA